MDSVIKNDAGRDRGIDIGLLGKAKAACVVHDLVEFGPAVVKVRLCKNYESLVLFSLLYLLKCGHYIT